MNRGDHALFVEQTKVPHLEAIDRDLPAAVGDHEGGRPVRTQVSAVREHRGNRRSSLAGSLAALVERHASQQDREALLGQSETAAGGGPVSGGGVAVEVDAIGNDVDRVAPRIVEARAAQFTGQPTARRHKRERQAAEPAAAAAMGAGRGRGEPGADLRARPAAHGESRAARRIVAATGEGPHVVECPDHRRAGGHDPPDRLRADEPRHPVQVHDIGRRHGRVRRDVPGRPVGREHGVADVGPRVLHDPPQAAFRGQWLGADGVARDDVHRGATAAESRGQALHRDRSAARMAAVRAQAGDSRRGEPWATATDTLRGDGDHRRTPSMNRESGLCGRPAASASSS